VNPAERDEERERESERERERMWLGFELLNQVWGGRNHILTSMHTDNLVAVFSPFKPDF